MKQTLKLLQCQPGDLSFIVGLEGDETVAPFIRPWTLSAHAAGLSDPTLDYRVAWCGSDPVGFVILRTSAVTPADVEFMRLAVARRGQGMGAVIVKAVLEYAQRKLMAQRVWLDVFPENVIAQHVYASVGFLRGPESYTQRGFGGKPGKVICMEYQLGVSCSPEIGAMESKQGPGPKTQRSDSEIF